jgi:hypothetical protein
MKDKNALIEIREPRGGDENLSQLMKDKNALIEIRDPRRGDENHSSGVPIARYCYIEIKDPRGGDENQMGLIFLASS